MAGAARKRQVRRAVEELRALKENLGKRGVRGAARALLEKLARQLLDLSTAEELVQLVEGGRPEWWTPVLVERFLEQPNQAIERGQAQQEAPAPGLA